MKRDPALVRLSRDHQRGLALAVHVERRLAASNDDDLAAIQQEVLSFWQSGLLPHFRAECECLLARLVRHVMPEDELIARTQGDHLRIDAMMTTMRDGVDRDEQRRLLGDVGELLRDHIRWEEAVLFEATQADLSPAELRAVGRDLAERIPEVPPTPSWLGRSQV